MRALTLHQPWAQLMVWGIKNIETRSWPAPRDLIGERIVIHAGKRKPRPTDWNIEVQRVVLQRAGNSHSMPMGAVVATARLIECMQVLSESDSGGMVNCRGFGELGDGPEYASCLNKNVTQLKLLPHVDVTQVRSLPHNGVTHVEEARDGVAGETRASQPGPRCAAATVPCPDPRHRLRQRQRVHQRDSVELVCRAEHRVHTLASVPQERPGLDRAKERFRHTALRRPQPLLGTDRRSDSSPPIRRYASVREPLPAFVPTTG